MWLDLQQAVSDLSFQLFLTLIAIILLLLAAWVADRHALRRQLLAEKLKQYAGKEEETKRLICGESIWREQIYGKPIWREQF